MSTPARYRKRSVEVEAIQWTGDNYAEVVEFLGEDFGGSMRGPGFDEVFVITLEGSIKASLNDWIICGTKGEHYPCKPDIFAAIYDPTSESDDTEAVHGWFSLSYANYLVLPRTLMQSMPGPWQVQMVRLLEEITDAFQHVQQAEAYNVQAGHWAYTSDLSEGELKSLGFTRPDAPDGDDENAEMADVWYGPDGEEHDGHTASIFIPTADPVPHYNRGRARIQPSPKAAAA